MKKLIKQYEEKNKTIQQIQKNLRMIQQKFRKTNSKLTTKLTKPSFQFDLPTIINVKNGYTPKSYSNSADKNYGYPVLYNEQKYQITQRVKNKQSKSWIQTISYRDRQRENKNTILTNHRTNIRKLMNTTQKQHYSSRKPAKSLQNSEIFMSPNKIYLANKLQKIKETPKLNIIKQMQQNLKTQDNFFHQDYPIQNLNRFQQFNANLVECLKYTKNLRQKKLQQISQQVQKGLANKLNDNSQKQIQLLDKDYKNYQQQINFQTINTVILPTNRYYLAHKKSKSIDHSYTPWNFQQSQNTETNQIWNIGLQKK